MGVITFVGNGPILNDIICKKPGHFVDALKKMRLAHPIRVGVMRQNLFFLNNIVSFISVHKRRPDPIEPLLPAPVSTLGERFKKWLDDLEPLMDYIDVPIEILDDSLEDLFELCKTLTDHCEEPDALRLLGIACRTALTGPKAITLEFQQGENRMDPALYDLTLKTLSPNWAKRMFVAVNDPSAKTGEGAMAVSQAIAAGYNPEPVESPEKIYSTDKADTAAGLCALWTAAYITYDGKVQFAPNCPTLGTIGAGSFDEIWMGHEKRSAYAYRLGLDEMMTKGVATALSELDEDDVIDVNGLPLKKIAAMAGHEEVTKLYELAKETGMDRFFPLIV